MVEDAEALLTSNGLQRPIPLAWLLLGIMAMPASAQEVPDTVIELEEVEVVVGSRAGVADPATLPVPVDIYGAEEIARLGEVDLGEVLGRIAPSFNSTRFSAGDGAALHVATLRGMNPDQVLVLVNGKRPPQRYLRKGARCPGSGHHGYRPARHTNPRSQANRGVCARARRPNTVRTPSRA